MGSTGSVGQGARVDSWLRSIVVDVSGEGGLLSIFKASTSLLATTACVASLSLGRSVSARTTIGPTLLLLGELGVSQLALHSTKLVGLWALTAATGGAFLLEGEHGCLDDSFQLQILDLVRGRLAEYLRYNLHSRGELAEDNHCLHRGREVKASVLEIREVAEHLCNCGSGMGASENGCREELAKLSVSRADTGGTKALLKVIPDLLHSSKLSNSDLMEGVRHKVILPSTLSVLSSQLFWSS